jgi:predicted TIM-barrel fold metal-dependent hydrolase
MTEIAVPPRLRSMAELREWHTRSTEEALDPTVPIIDAHHHMWDRPPEHYGLYELLEEFGQGHNVRASVFVECAAMFKADGPDALKPVGETEYVNGVAAMSASGIYGPSRLCAGIVSYADLRAGADVRRLLEAHIRAGGDRFRGVRQQAQYDEVLGSMARRSPPRGLLAQPEFRAGFAELAPLGLSFDAYLYCTQLGELQDLAEAFPETAIVLNHAGTPLGIGPYANRRGEVFRTWSESMRRLAACPNVTVKIGGLGMVLCGFEFQLQESPPTSAKLADAWGPYVDLCIAAFGPERCMFESNFPVDKQSCGYVVLWNAFKRLTGHLPADARNNLFSGTARRVYRLDDETSG